MLISLALVGTPQVNPGEDHGQLRRLDFDIVATGGVGQLEGPGLELLVPDRQPATVKIKDLDPISATVEEGDGKRDGKRGRGRE